MLIGSGGAVLGEQHISYIIQPLLVEQRTSHSQTLFFTFNFMNSNTHTHTHTPEYTKNQRPAIYIYMYIYKAGSLHLSQHHLHLQTTNHTNDYKVHQRSNPKSKNTFLQVRFNRGPTPTPPCNPQVKFGGDDLDHDLILPHALTSEVSP